MLPFVSVIIPSYNEEKFITRVLDNVVEQDYPNDRLEVIAVDGNSEDITRELILAKAREYPIIKLLMNENQYVPFALNLGISNSRGEVIIIMSSHSSYPVNYISLLVESLYNLKTDNVGGVLINSATDTSIISSAIAKVLSSIFGVGPSYFRIGSKNIKKVDTVPFGCYHRSVFDRIGLFDEELIRNQDDEFNARLIKHGGSIHLIPEVKITYYTRDSVKALWKMYFQYGLFKPLVNLKLKRSSSLRQFFPPAFLLFLLFSIAGSYFSPLILYGLIGVWSIYLITDLLFTLKIVLESRRPLFLIFLPWLFPILHLAYGMGYLTGILKFVINKEKPSANFAK